MVVDRTFDPIAEFLRSAKAVPDRPALAVDGTEWSYAQLDHLSAQVAAWCNAHCSEESRVAVHGAKTVWAYVAILGILRSGRSYVPLHPEHPPQRWCTMLERAAVRTVLCASEHTSSVSLPPSFMVVDEHALQAQAPSAEVRVGPEAYLMFTSGSTGVPKGVPVGRAQLAAYLGHVARAFPFTSTDRFTQFFALSFDLSVHDLFVCWGAGACLCVPSSDAVLRAVSYVREQRITVWFSVPSQVALMRRMRSLVPGCMPDLRLAFFCGEALSTEVARNWCHAVPSAASYNLYGPTETTIAIAVQPLTSTKLDGTDEVVPLGRVFPGHRAQVLHDDTPSLVGEGELLLAGPQVNAGYLNDEAATKRCFRSFGPDEVRWYHTGDRVRMDADGVLHFMGRMDDQVKLNGHRVEPGEVDAVLQPLLNGGNAATVAVKLDGGLRLVTFIDVPADTGPMFAALRTRLPDYMVPVRIIPIEAFPYGPHGKLDWKALITLAQNG
jgi:amino acid adenylation domain-containing protein